MNNRIFILQKTLLLVVYLLFLGGIAVAQKNGNQNEETHEYVEIGGVKWATMNLGATTIAGSYTTCNGDYYAWGEIAPRYIDAQIAPYGKTEFSGWKSNHRDGYILEDAPKFKGKILDSNHDAATWAWGSQWRTPTTSDFEKLFEACTDSCLNGKIIHPKALPSATPSGGVYWLYSSQKELPEYSGVNGLLFVDKTDTSKRVFFPACSYVLGQNNYRSTADAGMYWSADSDSPKDGRSRAFHLKFSHFWDTEVSISVNDAFFGYQIRPVAK